MPIAPAPGRYGPRPRSPTPGRIINRRNQSRLSTVTRPLVSRASASAAARPALTYRLRDRSVFLRRCGDRRRAPSAGHPAAPPPISPASHAACRESVRPGSRSRRRTTGRTNTPSSLTPKVRVRCWPSFSAAWRFFDDRALDTAGRNRSGEQPVIPHRDMAAGLARRGTGGFHHRRQRHAMARLQPLPRHFQHFEFIGWTWVFPAASKEAGRLISFWAVFASRADLGMRRRR